LNKLKNIDWLPFLFLAPVIIVRDKSSLYPYFEPKLFALALTTFIILAFWSFKRKTERSFHLLDVFILAWFLGSVLSLIVLTDFRIGIESTLFKAELVLVYSIFRWMPGEKERIIRSTALAIIFFVEIQSLVVTAEWLLSISRGLKPWDNSMILGTLGFHTFTAAFIVLGLVVCFPLFEEAEGKWKRLLTLVYLHSAGALLLLQCRAAFLSLMIVLFVESVLRVTFILKGIVKVKNLGKSLSAVIFLLILLVTAVIGTKEKVGGMWERTKEDIFSSRLTGRRLIWLSGWEMIKDKPVVGYGPGGFYFNYIPYQGEVMKKVEPKRFYPVREMVIWAHNDFLQEYIELGLAGLLLLAVVLFPPFYIFLKLRENIWARALALSLVAFLVIAMVDFPLHRPVESVFLMVLLAICGKFLSKKIVPDVKIGRCFSIAIVVLAALPFILSNFDYYSKRLYARAVIFESDLVKKEILLKKSIKYSLNDGQAKAAMGALQCQKGDTRKGITLMEEALTTFRDAYLYENIGKAFLESAMPAKAMEYYEKAMYSGIKYIEDGTYYAKACFMAGDPDKGKKLLESLLTLSQRNNSLVKAVAGLKINEQKYDEALKIIGQAKNKKDPELMVLKSVAHIRKGQIDTACENLLEVLSINENYVPAIINLGVIRMIEGRDQEAMAFFNKALKLDPSSKAAKANIEMLQKECFSQGP